MPSDVHNTFQGEWRGDFSRDTFDPRKHFSRVLVQQGRVQVDADWNEQTSILLHYLRTLAEDIIGPHGGPKTGMGFLISRKVDDAKDVDEARRAEIKKALDGHPDVLIGPGRYYVRGVLVENEEPLLFSEQPGHSDRKDWESLKGMFFYLDVWERHITCSEDDEIRESALGGPDTCTRAQVVWRVRAMQTEDPPSSRCPELPQEQDTGKLRAKALQDKMPTNLCVISPESRYRGAENQLYRVEVHQVDPNHSARVTFKWSRENGSVSFPIRSLAGGMAVVEHLGRDRHLGLEPGDWVEIVDDGVMGNGEAGPMARVESVDRDELRVRLKPTTDSLPDYGHDTLGKHPLLRRWDQVRDVDESTGAIKVEAGEDSHWFELEDGVQVQFAGGGIYTAGDYWLVPARTYTGDVDWRHEPDADGNPIPIAEPPHGPKHYCAPLMYFSDGENGTDCRCHIDPYAKCPGSSKGHSGPRPHRDG
jgi:uncharacterized protein DUF6519